MLSQMIRFFIVSAGGAAIDIGIAYLLISQFGIPLWLAACVGFLSAGLGNYFLHALWTFRGDNPVRLSGRHAVCYLANSVIVLMTRLAVVTWLGNWMPEDYALLVLIGGVAISFLVNYFLTKALIVAKSSEYMSNKQ